MMILYFSPFSYKEPISMLITFAAIITFCLVKDGIMNYKQTFFSLNLNKNYV